MAKFTTRVELHNMPQDYSELHEAMEKSGFTRTIWSENTEYQLPTAEYNFEGEKTTDQVRDLAAAAAATVDKDFAVLVTKADGPRSWHGLKKVKK